MNETITHTEYTDGSGEVFFVRPNCERYYPIEVRRYIAPRDRKTGKQSIAIWTDKGSFDPADLPAYIAALQRAADIARDLERVDLDYWPEYTPVDKPLRIWRTDELRPGDVASLYDAPITIGYVRPSKFYANSIEVVGAQDGYHDHGTFKSSALWAVESREGGTGTTYYTPEVQR